MSAEARRFIPLAEAAEALAGELDLDGVLQRITDTAAQATGARYAALGVIGPGETIARFSTILAKLQVARRAEAAAYLVEHRARPEPGDAS